MSEVTQAQMEKALNYLAMTDEDYGELVGRCKGIEHRLKGTKAALFLEAVGNNMERESKALIHVDYQNLVDRYENLQVDKEIMSAKRRRAELTIEVWRSLNANRRQG